MNTRTIVRLFGLPVRLVKHQEAHIRALLAGRKLRQLPIHECESLTLVREALIETLDNFFSREERAYLNHIELRRSQLLRSKKWIDDVNYGYAKGRQRRSLDGAIRSTKKVADVCRDSSIPPFWGRMLFKLVRKLKPVSCVELGTCVGLSAAYQASALSLNGKGFLRTLEGSPEIAGIARTTCKSLNLDNVSISEGAFATTLLDVLNRSSPIDLFFNDGDHHHDAVMRIFEDSLSYLAPRGIIVCDDVSWSTEMRRAWIEIEEDHRISATLDLRRFGIALLGTGMKAEAIRLPL